jgi:hypothetical protein
MNLLAMGTVMDGMAMRHVVVIMSLMLADLQGVVCFPTHPAGSDPGALIGCGGMAPPETTSLARTSNYLRCCLPHRVNPSLSHYATQ